MTKAERAVREAIGDIISYIGVDQIQNRILVRLKKDFSITFDTLDALAFALETKVINLTHSQAHYYSSWTYDDEESDIEILNVPGHLFAETP